MVEHLHPISKVPIQGTLLLVGIKLLETDRYASTKGNWELNPVPGAILQGHGTVWIRPSGDLATLSEDGRNLLCYLAHNNFLLTQDSWHWKIIPALHWKHDGRMDWGIRNPECIPDLITRGFLLPHPCDHETYEVTDAGREVAKILVQ